MQNGSPGFCHTFNYDALIHPSEHAGKNRFHLISPLNNDEVFAKCRCKHRWREFYQHNDATVYTGMKDQSDIEARLNTFNTNLKIVSNRLNKSVERIVSEITCGKFTRVDALLLKGVLNLKLKLILERQNYFKSILKKISSVKMTYWR